MTEPGAVQLRELLRLITSLLERVGLSTDSSERANLLRNLRFLLNLADEAIARDFPVE